VEGGNGIKTPKSHWQQDLETCAIIKELQIQMLQMDLQDQVQCEWISRVLKGKTHGFGIPLERRYRLDRDLCSSCKDDFDLLFFSTSYYKWCQTSLNEC